MVDTPAQAAVHADIAQLQKDEAAKAPGTTLQADLAHLQKDQAALGATAQPQRPPLADVAAPLDTHGNPMPVDKLPLPLLAGTTPLIGGVEATTAGDPQAVKIAITMADKKARLPVEPWVGIREEQLARSAEIEAMGVEPWKAAHDMRPPGERPQLQVQGVKTTPPIASSPSVPLDTHGNPMPATPIPPLRPPAP
jgi:hypothetical protein